MLVLNGCLRSARGEKWWRIWRFVMSAIVLALTPRNTVDAALNDCIWHHPRFQRRSNSSNPSLARHYLIALLAGLISLLPVNCYWSGPIKYFQQWNLQRTTLPRWDRDQPVYYASVFPALPPTS